MHTRARDIFGFASSNTRRGVGKYTQARKKSAAVVMIPKSRKIRNFIVIGCTRTRMQPGDKTQTGERGGDGRVHQLSLRASKVGACTFSVLKKKTLLQHSTEHARTNSSTERFGALINGAQGPTLKVFSYIIGNSREARDRRALLSPQQHTKVNTSTLSGRCLRFPNLVE